MTVTIGRRELLAALGGAAAWPLAARAQQPKVWHVGFLAPVPPTPAMLSALRDGLRERGYVEGQNLSIDVRWSEGSFEQNPGLAADLVRSNVDVIVAWSSPAVFADRRATSTIPIVMASVGDPVAMGFVTNLARPGGNVTGLSNMAHDLSGKLVELFVEIVPSMKHVGVVQNPSNPSMPFILSKTENAIRALGLRFEVVDAKSGEEFEAALQSLSAKGVNGVVLLADPSLVENRRRIAEVALKTQIPTAFQRRESVEAGGLFSYGSSLSDQLRLATLYVDRILKGTKPAELPVEQPTKFELVVNLKTAKSLGLDIPSTLLATADEVIE